MSETTLAELRTAYFASEQQVQDRNAIIAKLEAALEALTQGSTIRVYGCSYSTREGERRNSIALTEKQRKLLALALIAKEGGDDD